MLRKWIALFLIGSGSLFATDLKPWYPDALQLQGKLDYRFQTYNSLDAPGKNRNYSSDDSFVDGSIMAVYDPYSFEVEVQFADTRKRNFDWDHIGVTARYLWLDDNVGDPFSLTTGITLSRAWREALNDISSFHHGQNEAFFHAAIGKQVVFGNEWLSRWWGVFGVGIADRWTPWIVANANYEWNYCNMHRFRLFANSLWGCGNQRLKVEDFGGYARINHHSIDIGGGYTYLFNYYGSLSFNYAYRVYAHNFPNHASQFVISYNYPFGPEGDYYILKAYSLLTGQVNPF